MTNSLLHLTTVLILGTTWIALKLQLGTVPIPWSIAHRFWLAAAVMLAWLAWRGGGRDSLRLPPRAIWPHLLGQGICLFCDWAAPALFGLVRVAAGNVVVFRRGASPRLRSA